MITIDVYTAVIPENLEIKELSSLEREEEIKNSPNLKVKKERYFAWKLLEFALKNSFDKKAKDITFTKNEFGKWTTKDCFFSISHSSGAVAVALSKAEVGVDIELLKEVKKGAIEKTLTKEEEVFLSTLKEEEKQYSLIEIWSKKESYFKMANLPTFCPSTINTLQLNYHSGKINIGCKKYLLSVFAKDLKNLRFYENCLIER